MAAQPADDNPVNSEIGAGETQIPNRCESCGGLPRWESITDDAWGERWLAVCPCGRIDTFFPDRRHPDQQPNDPLLLFLQGHARPPRPATPPWVRFFLNSLKREHPVEWVHDPGRCPQCEAATVFDLLTWVRVNTVGQCQLCLNCGYVCTWFANPVHGHRPPPLDGTAWMPACPAVSRLRECVAAWQQATRASSDPAA